MCILKRKGDIVAIGEQRTWIHRIETGGCWLGMMIGEQDKSENRETKKDGTQSYGGCSSHVSSFDQFCLLFGHQSMALAYSSVR